jgi:hypothetical protein
VKPLQPRVHSDDGKVVSPFSQNEVVVESVKKPYAKSSLIIICCLLLIAVGAVAGVFVMRYLNDPYRTLEPFPVAKYFDNYQSLAGSKFKAELRVEADLGWRDGAGRLMLFSTADDPRPIAVLIPVAVAKDLYFTKGQTYLTQAEVKEGGLIYADSCEKN